MVIAPCNFIASPESPPPPSPPPGAGAADCAPRWLRLPSKTTSAVVYWVRVVAGGLGEGGRGGGGVDFLGIDWIVDRTRRKQLAAALCGPRNALL